MVNCTPCELSSTVSLSGQRVAAMRRRSSASSSSGTSTWKGRISLAVSTPVVLMTTSFARWGGIRMNPSDWGLAVRVGSGMRAPFTKHGYLAKRPECGPHLRCEELRLFPGGEVAAPVGLVEVGEVGVRLLGPAARGPPDLPGERGEPDRDRNFRRSLGDRGGGSIGPVGLPVGPGGEGGG